jgi:hypothetical protein
MIGMEHSACAAERHFECAELKFFTGQPWPLLFHSTTGNRKPEIKNSAAQNLYLHPFRGREPHTEYQNGCYEPSG